MSNYSIVDACLQLGATVRTCVDMRTGEIVDNPVTGGASRPLSPPHNRTIGAKITGWVGGGLVKAEKAKPESREQNGGGIRSTITQFTSGARLRFMRMMGTIQKSDLPVFVTLTYPDEFPHDPGEWYKHFQRLRMRLHRKGWGAIWRRELKNRQTGENAGRLAPHYHLLVWGASQAEIMAYIPYAWHKIAGAGDKNHLAFMLGELKGSKPCAEQVESWNGVAAYVGKYMAKIEDLHDLDNFKSVGRFWGVVNREAIPWAEAVEMTLDNKTVNTFFRYMRNYLEAEKKEKARVKGKKYHKTKCRGSWPSSTIFCCDPWRWLEVAAVSLEG